MIDAGNPFPRFALRDENGELLDSKNLLGIRYVVFFRSEDGTPECTKVALDFTSLFANFMLRNIPVIGIGKDLPSVHRRIIDENGLKIKLLSDPDCELADRIGIQGTEYGEDRKGAAGSTFVIGKNGNTEAVWAEAKGEGHARNVLDKVVSLCKNGS